MFRVSRDTPFKYTDFKGVSRDTQHTQISKKDPILLFITNLYYEGSNQAGISLFFQFVIFLPSVTVIIMNMYDVIIQEIFQLTSNIPLLSDILT